MAAADMAQRCQLCGLEACGSAGCMLAYVGILHILEAGLTRSCAQAGPCQALGAGQHFKRMPELCFSMRINGEPLPDPSNSA